eukprot:gnl/MRDRNA2_/MRDRNA2_264233_c0_seq1.p1 gnl/MRDRNA2_/MRDRNA2_264233_c0~~gnl/MRDRNA2_/MRDRNA2_264233_c0_seq1.p1  ORF type:complete len:181 (-),score=24.62 gnl/MRDRNA2_/MRDRNA2_264233_c0_seq1:7-549(-)
MQSLSHLITSLVNPHNGVKLAHLDLHAGNLFLSTGGVVTAIDYGKTLICCESAHTCADDLVTITPCSSQPQWESESVVQAKMLEFWLMDFIALLIGGDFAAFRKIRESDFQPSVLDEHLKPEYQEQMHSPACDKCDKFLKMLLKWMRSLESWNTVQNFVWPPQDLLVSFNQAHEEVHRNR